MITIVLLVVIPLTSASIQLHPDAKSAFAIFGVITLSSVYIIKESVSISSAGMRTDNWDTNRPPSFVS